MAKNQPKQTTTQATPPVMSVQRIETSHQGPLPPAQEFARYEETCPGAAATILRMAEAEQLHRHKTETALVESEQEDVRKTHNENILAYWLAFIVVMSFLGLGFTLTLYGHDWVGGIMMGTSLVSIVASFLKRRK